MLLGYGSHYSVYYAGDAAIFAKKLLKQTAVFETKLIANKRLESGIGFEQRVELGMFVFSTVSMNHFLEYVQYAVHYHRIVLESLLVTIRKGPLRGGTNVYCCLCCL